MSQPTAPYEEPAKYSTRGDLGISAPPPVLAAHSPNDGGRWHSLADHLAGAGQRAASFGEPFGSAEACRLVGELHDLGKADPAWQRYLAAAATGTRLATVDHKHAGAFLCEDWGLGTFAFVIAGHHGGIPDAKDLRVKMADGPTDGQRAAMRLVEQLGVSRPEVQATIPQFVLSAGTDAIGRRRMEFWLRMVFSALVDADRLDTEEHFRPGFRGTSQPTRLDDLVVRCQARRSVELVERQHDPVAPARAEMFEEVMSRADDPPGWFELTAPTGSGKTIAALSFALRHAARNGHRRVVTAVPFISVTEQVAGIYRDLLEDESGLPVVLEHHSGVFSTSEAQAGVGLWSRLAAENWDARVVVTTTVQLLESLFGNHPSRTRKLHRLAQSVILLDEVQSLPWRLLDPTLDVLRELVRSYGCSVVLSTATQPPFDKIGSVAGVERRSLAGAHWFGVFDRVDADVIRDPVSWDDFGSRVVAESNRHQGQCLVVLNTIADAREVCSRLTGRQGLAHLSSRLCPAHRIDVLQWVISQLRDGQPCTLISTQLVEAGIDVDFPVGIRAYGPLPAIVQVAGRVNRHGLAQRGRLVVADPEYGSVPPDEYKIGTQICRELLRDGGVNPFAPETLETYYLRLIRATNDKLDKLQIQRERELLNFSTVAERYRVIADDTRPVLVAYGGFDPVQTVIPEDPGRRRAFLRQHQRYTVSLRARELDRCQSLVEEPSPGVLVWHGPYDPVFGLSVDKDAEALIW